MGGLNEIRAWQRRGLSTYVLGIQDAWNTGFVAASTRWPWRAGPGGREGACVTATAQEPPLVTAQVECADSSPGSEAKR